MENIVFSFLMTTLAGFSTLLGIIPCYLNKTRESIISKSLAFSAGVMLMISLSSLIPESVSLLSLKYSYIFIFIIVFIFVVLGILFSSFIDQKIEERFTSNKLYKLGLISIIALCLHNIPEGITTFISTTSNVRLGITLSIVSASFTISSVIFVTSTTLGGIGFSGFTKHENSSITSPSFSFIIPYFCYFFCFC